MWWCGGGSTSGRLFAYACLPMPRRTTKLKRLFMGSSARSIEFIRGGPPPSAQYFLSATKARTPRHVKCVFVVSLFFLSTTSCLPCLAPSTLTCSPPCLAGACLSLPCLPFPWTIHLHCDLSLHGAACSLRHAACSLRHAACSLKHQEVGPAVTPPPHPHQPASDRHPWQAVCVNPRAVAHRRLPLGDRAFLGR